MLTATLFALVVLVAIAIASLTRRPVATTFALLSFPVALLVASLTDNGFSIAASWLSTLFAGLLLQTIAETFALLVRREDSTRRRPGRRGRSERRSRIAA